MSTWKINIKDQTATSINPKVSAQGQFHTKKRKVLGEATLPSRA
jgi:hypothetical protein